MKFPETNVVNVIFRYRNSSAWVGEDYADPERAKVMKRYSFVVPEYLKGQINMGDAVLVYCSTGFQLAEVDAINVLTSERGLKPIVCKVDLHDYFNEVERRNTLAHLKERILKEKKRLEAMVTFDLLATHNPEFKEMLDLYKSLGGTF